MYAIKIHNKTLSIVELSGMQILSKPRGLITLNKLSEAMIVVDYLSCHVANVKLGKFEPRWESDCYVCAEVPFKNHLCAISVDDFSAQLDANNRQRIEFVFEEYVINLDPAKIEYFQYDEITCPLSELRVIAHTPTILSLVAHSKGVTKLVAGYNLSLYRQRLAS
ncbi:hypothetical protein NTH44_003115 [Vibrio metoecus]|nr:hypothetical protein [Vibrio cholerae]